MSTKYVCTGSCGGSVTEAEHAGGKTTCGAADCDKHGQPLQKQVCDDESGTCSMPGSDSDKDDHASGCGDGCTCC